MVCKTRMSLIGPPTTNIFAAFFICGGITAIVGNVIALVILFIMPAAQKSLSNKVLTALALCDLLVGAIVFPITSFQVLNHRELINCTVDYTRVYFSAFLQGASVLNLAVIALDRYLLMTKMTIYHKKNTRKVILLLMVLAWVIPATSPTLRWISKDAYLAVTITIFLVPFLILLFSYIFITKALKDQQEKLRKQQISSFEVGCSTNNLVQNEHGSNDSQGPVTIFKEPSTTGQSKENCKSQRSHIKVAKSVTLLLVAYFCCIAPLNTWLILDLINANHPFIPAHAHQNFYLFAMVTVSYNSCINPMIYFWKNPDIRKGFIRLFKLKKINR